MCVKENFYQESNDDRPRTLFELYLTEAPGDDDPPDISGPPDMPDETANDAPPDMADETGDSGEDVGNVTDDGPPPDMDDTPDDSMGDFGADENGEDSDADKDTNKNLDLDEKVSAILNMNLYQRFESMLTKITGQIGSMKSNLDILHAISSDVPEIIDALSKLSENIRLYMKNSFMSENYSKNLLFFNKCLNLMKLLNDSFDKAVRKGIKDAK